jgi:hypothetical protein
MGQLRSFTYVARVAWVAASMWVAGCMGEFGPVPEDGAVPRAPVAGDDAGAAGSDGGADAGAPGPDAGASGFDGGADAGAPGADAGASGFDGGADAGAPGADAGASGFDGGVDAGAPGADAGASGFDGGADAGAPGSDAGAPPSDGGVDAGLVGPLRAQDDVITLDEGQFLEVDVLANDVRPASAALTLDPLTPPATGLALALPSGRIRFTAPAPGSFRCGLGPVGSALVPYRVRDTVSGATSTAALRAVVRGTQPCAPGSLPPVPPAFVPRAPFTPGLPTTGQSWCNPQAWPQYGNQVPGPGASVMIQQGQVIRLDCDPAELGALHVHGVLEVPNTRSVTLRAASIHVMGAGARLQIGSHSAPFPRAQRAVIELTGARSTHTPRWPMFDNALDNDGEARGLHVMNGGELILVGETPQTLVTRLAQSAPAGATQLRVRGDVAQAGAGWRVGDVFAIAYNDFWRLGTHEILRVVAPGPAFDGVATTIPFESLKPGQVGLARARFAQLQYPLDTPVIVDGGLSGVAFTPGPFTPPSSLTPTVLDEAPHVALLSRPIVLQAKDDADWRTRGWGFHTMAMRSSSSASVPTYLLEGVELHRGGQANAMARYPIHAHMLSYTPQFDGQLNASGPTKVAFRRNAVWESTNRAITLHGTSNVPVHENVVVDVLGHAVFLEDGSETKNQLIGNVVMGVNPCDTRRRFWRENDTSNPTQPSFPWSLPERSTANPAFGLPIECHLKASDQWGEDGASGYWLTNPDNWFERNVVSGARVGIWNSFSDRVFGVSAQVGARGPGNSPIDPSTSPLLSQRDNIAYSNLTFGMRTNGAVLDEAGRTGIIRFSPAVAPVFHGVVLFKNDVAYDNRVKEPKYVSWTVADNRWGFAGATFFDAHLSDLLLVGTSLHRANPVGMAYLPALPDDRARVGMSSYHHMLQVFRLVAINYEPSPVVMGTDVGSNVTFAGGVFAGIDLYLWPSNRVGLQNTQWKLVNAFPGFLTLPGWFDTFPVRPGGSTNGRYFGIGSSLDPYGVFYPRPGLWLMPDAAYFTHGLTECPPGAAVHPSEGTCDFRRVEAFPGARYRVATHRVPVGVSQLDADATNAFVNYRVRYRRLAVQTVNGVADVPVGASAFIAPQPHPADGRNLAEHDSPPNTLALRETDFTELLEGAAVRVTLYDGAAEVLPTSGLRLTFEGGDRLPAGRHVIFALPWGHAARPAVVRLGHTPRDWTGSVAGFPATAFRELDAAATSLADLVGNNPTGRKVFFDAANGLLWVKVMGGLTGGPLFASCAATPGIPNEASLDERCLRSATSLFISRN